MKIWYLLAGAYLCYCWGVAAFYVASWGILGGDTKWADRTAYAVKWPLAPLMAPFVVLYMMFWNRGTSAQKTEAASRLWEKMKPSGKPFMPYGRGEEPYNQ